MMNKGGVSGVVVAILLILIVIAAVGILWAVISGFMEANAERIEMGANTVRLDVVNAHYNNGFVNFTVTRDTGMGNVSYVKLIAENEDMQSQSMIVELELKELETKTGGFFVRGSPAISPGVIERITKLYAVPVFKGKYGEYTGMMSEEYVIGKEFISEVGLVSYWSFDNGPEDLKGMNNGSLVGDPVLVKGMFGRAYELDGGGYANGDYIDVADADSLDIIKDITVAFWVNPKGYYSGWETRFISKGTTVGNSHFKANFYGSSSATSRRNKTAFQAYKTQNAVLGWYFISSFSPELELDSWHNIVLSRKASIGGELYVDGISQGNPNYLDGGNLMANNVNLRIGENSFNGSIDEVRIYNRSLDAEEVYQLYKHNG